MVGFGVDGHIYVWFTLSDLSHKVNRTHSTLSAEKKACCIIKVIPMIYTCRYLFNNVI